MKIVILASAQKDLVDGFAFYQDQRDEAGTYFLSALMLDIDSLKIYAGHHRKVFGFHRLLSRRFPYAVYYTVELNTVYIRAVLDCRRGPDWMQDRLK